MEKQQLTNTENAKLKATSNGNLRATYTMVVSFFPSDRYPDGGRFTYRSDKMLENYSKKGYKYINELDALVLYFSEKKMYFNDCKIFDNRKPIGEETLLHYSGLLSNVLVNNLPTKYRL